MAKTREQWEKEKAEFVKKAKADREQVNKYLQRDLDNPVIYTHSVTVVDEYYYQKIVLGLMIWLLVAYLGLNPFAQFALVVIFIYKFL